MQHPMQQSMRRQLSNRRLARLVWILALLACGVWAAGCGSDVSGDPCEEDGQPCEGGGVCSGGVCVAPDAGADGEGDVVQPPVDAGERDVAPPEDTPAEDVVVPPGRDVAVWDTSPPDLIPDRTPPFVVSFEPGDGEADVPTDFVVRVVFDGPLRATTIVKRTATVEGTFSVTDVNGDEVEGTLELLPDPGPPTSLVFRPSDPVRYGSPYRVELTPAIMDLAGNRMAEYLRWRFFTEPLPLPADLTAVAERYAPHVRQQTLGPAPEYDYLAPFDLDGDWDLTNSVQAIRQATSVPAVVYYAVVETKSHWFVTYLYYHPFRDGEVASYGNDLAGAQVVVQRYPEERPLAVQLWFQTSTQQDVLAYVTQESGLSGAYVTESYPQAELFPDGRYPAFLTAVEHQSCLWIDRNNGFPLPCRLSDAEIGTMTIVEYVPAQGAGEALHEEDGVFPFATEDDPVGYVLQDILIDLWPRRMDVQPLGVVFDESFEFLSQPDRPGAGTRLGSAFVNPTADDGAGIAPWAWDWRPTAGGFVQLERGTFFLDPAWFLKKRFPGLPDWDGATRTGVSDDYCYHPFLHINERSTDPECAVPTR